MGKSRRITVGYRYYFGIHMGICRGPVNELVEIRVAEKTAWAGRWTGNGRLQISAGNLFGGDKAEGGIDGPLDIYMGDPDQDRLAPLESMVGSRRPAFRGRFTAFFDGLVCSLNPYPKAWSFRVRRTTSGWDGSPWYASKATVLMTRPTSEGEVTSESEIYAMNPAHIIYECLTNRDWGRGLDFTRLNVGSFTQAADYLHGESFGLCLRWVRRDSLKNFIQSVLDHIGGALYNDRSTGLITLKLIRFDYDADTLPVYDADTGLISVEEAPAAALGPMINECKITYRDPITNTDKTVTVQNLASIQASNGSFNSISKNFPGIPTPELALRVAQRELRSAAVGIRRFKLKFDRRAWRIAPASVIKIRDRSRGINDMIVRVGRIEGGTLLNSAITITAVNDVFSLPLNAYTVQPPPPTKPTFKAKPAESAIFEMPYFLLNRYVPAADFAYIGEEDGYLGTVAAKPDDVHGGYDLGIRDGAPEPEDQP